MATNRIDDREIAVPSLRLPQLSLVYVNTLMIQEVLASPAWSGRLTEEDTRGSTPLLCGHVSPHFRFDPDMSKRLPLADATRAS